MNREVNSSGAPAGHKAPGTLKHRLMRSMPIGRKMALMAASMIIPICGLLAYYVYKVQSDISVTRREIGGVEWFQPLEEMMGRISDHSAMVASSVVKGSSADKGPSKFQAELDQWITTMDGFDARYGKPDDQAAWKAIKDEWQTIKSTRYGTPEESLAAHDRLLGHIKAKKDKINADTGMVLDPELASFFTLDLAVTEIPDIEMFVGQSRAILAAVAAAGKATEAEKLNFIEIASITKHHITRVRDELEQTRKAAAGNPSVQKHLSGLPAGWDTRIETWLSDTEKAMLSGNTSAQRLEELNKNGDAIPESLDDVHDVFVDSSSDLLAARLSSDIRMLSIGSVLVLAALALSLWLTLAISKRVVGAIIRLRDVAKSISAGRYDNVFESDGEDEIAALFSGMGTMQTQLAEEEKHRAVAATRIAQMRGGLDAASTNVMVADAGNDIVYMNNAANTLFAELESDLRKELPQFSAKNLIGRNIDVFHKNPSHQKNLLANLRGMHKAQFIVGGRTVQFTANPIFDDKGARLGTVVEWYDKTQELAAERETLMVVEAVNKGDLGKRIPEDGKVGFYAVMAKNLNQVVANVSDVVDDVHKLVKAASSGDLSQRMVFEGKPGLTKTLGSGINDLVEEMANVVGEVQKLVDAANAGDLTQRIPVEGKGGLFQRVGGGVNGLVQNMAGVISQVKEAASEVHRGADEISQGNTHLSQRTEEQASSLVETASSMDEMTSTVKQNADNAGQANQLAVAARDQAEKGGAVVAKAVRAMTEINDSSKKIADIIGVIDEIAFQTNLLALNAAVEAARAGEQGRGFAVVATEVRNLAGRSATAAKEIKGLIQDSVKKVDEGSLLVTQSGATLEQIVAAVKKVTDIVAEIAAASQEQSAGIEQVNKAVMQLDELTQQNAALVEEASAASQSMADQARGLNETMAAYKVEDGGAARATARAISAGAAPKAERRSTVRPWAGKSGAAPAKAVSRTAVRAAPQADATGTDDATWKEF